jgi:flavorubredoxin
LWIGLIVVCAAIAAWAAWLFSGRNREVVSEMTVLNPAGEARTALVVYHPGKSDFQRRVFAGFAEGLESNGWRVEMTTPSPQTRTDLSGYDLLVLGGPTYGFTPNRPILRYLGRLGDLDGMRTVTIITALGMGERSTRIMEQRVRQANGTLVKALVLYKARPNDDDNYVDGKQNRELAVQMATRAAQEIDLLAIQGQTTVRD